MHALQRRYAIFLILICVGIGLAHQLEASLEPDHAGHCGVCIMGASSPAMSSCSVLTEFGIQTDSFKKNAFFSLYQSSLWPAYLTRAPPIF